MGLLPQMGRVSENAGDSGGWYCWNVAKWPWLGVWKRCDSESKQWIWAPRQQQRRGAALMAGQVLSGCTCGVDCSACHRGELGYLDYTLKYVGNQSISIPASDNAHNR